MLTGDVWEIPQGQKLADCVSNLPMVGVNLPVVCTNLPMVAVRRKPLPGKNYPNGRDQLGLILVKWVRSVI